MRRLMFTLWQALVLLACLMICALALGYLGAMLSSPCVP